MFSPRHDTRLKSSSSGESIASSGTIHARLTTTITNPASAQKISAEFIVSFRSPLSQFQRLLHQHQEGILLRSHFIVAGQEFRQCVQRLPPLPFVLELRRAFENRAPDALGSLRMLVHASKCRVDELLPRVFRAQVEAPEERFDPFVLGAGHVPILVHAQNQQIGKRGFLFVGKSLRVHATRLGAP